MRPAAEARFPERISLVARTFSANCSSTSAPAFRAEPTWRSASSRAAPKSQSSVAMTALTRLPPSPSRRPTSSAPGSSARTRAERARKERRGREVAIGQARGERVEDDVGDPSGRGARGGAERRAGRGVGEDVGCVRAARPDRGDKCVEVRLAATPRRRLAP